MPIERPACVVLRCRDLAANEAFFRELGFRLAAVFPADAPRELELSGHGLRICLQRGSRDGGGQLRVPGEAARELQAPNGARVDVVVVGDVPPALAVSAPKFVVHRGSAEPFHAGRAGMLYRDLLPGRLGGAWIASCIRIERGGPVPDYVHFHRLAAQALFCTAGRVRLVYEDQGEPFDMVAGDCVLQPPTIRHRVLECSDGFEVVEVASPAEHVTVVDPELALPTANVQRERAFAGQRFHHHRAAAAVWAPCDDSGLRRTDCGIGAASGGALGVAVLERDAAREFVGIAAAPAVRLWLPLRGSLRLRGDEVGVGDTAVLPAGRVLVVAEASADLQVLEFTLGAPSH